jgi:hypothetical protein
VARESQITIVISDYKRLIRELNKIEPQLSAELRSNFREIAAGPRRRVQISIPSQPPISGMRRKLSPVGKTWNTRGRARTVTVSVKSPKRAIGFGARDGAIIKLVIPSPATIIADMAGRGNVRRRGLTDWYVYPSSNTTTPNYRPGERRHTVTTQGDSMIKALGSNPSRYAYPAVEREMPETARKISEVIDRFTKEAERRING